MMSAPRVIRSNTRSVLSMITKTGASVNGTAAATTIPTRQPRLIRLTIRTTAKAAKNLIMNSSTASLTMTAWSLILVNRDAGRKFRGNPLLLGVECLAQLQRIPALFHDNAQDHGGLAVMANQEGCRVFVAALHLGDVGQFQVRPPAAIGVSAIA